MRRKLRNAFLVCGIILGLLVLVYPFLSSMAQQGQNQKNRKSQEQENALQVVRQNIVANIFYDTLQAQETDWMLIKADYMGGGEVVTKRGIEQGGKSIHLILQKDKSEVQVTIYEYASEEAAKDPLKLHISQGVIENCKGDECGDEGQKHYEGFNYKGENVGFVGLKFTKGRFYGSIYCNSEEVAKRLAGYALNAIANR